MEGILVGRRLPTVAASHGLGVEIPPFHAEVLGGRFAFWHFCQKWQNETKTSAWDGGF